MNKGLSNTAALLHWALHNGDTRRAKIIAGHLIAGTELTSYDLE